MICETFLKEKMYQELFTFIEENVLEGADQNIYDLDIEIIQMLFICSICSQTSLAIEGFKKYLLEEYDEDCVDLYDEIILHIQDYNEDVTFEFVEFLLKFNTHQRI